MPDEADLLLLVSPNALDIKQLFAVDQYLMSGGTVIMATSLFDIEFGGAVTASKNESALLEWLSHHGIEIEKQTVLDPQNASFPIPVDRTVGDFVFRETRMVSYPYFGDIRGDGITHAGGLTGDLDQVTMTWPSPITLDEQKNEVRTVTRLLESSDQAWTSDIIQIEPDFELHGELGFPVGDERGTYRLAVAVEGRFDSYLAGKPSPLLTQNVGAASEAAATQPVITRVIDRSPDTARIILFSSRSFLTDTMLDLATSGMGTRSLKPVEMLQNAIDWAIEDRGLVAIRGRTHFSRTLKPLDREAQLFWETLNYGLALFGLLLIGFIQRQGKQLCGVALCRRSGHNRGIVKTLFGHVNEFA